MADQSLYINVYKTLAAAQQQLAVFVAGHFDAKIIGPVPQVTLDDETGNQYASTDTPLYVVIANNQT